MTASALELSSWLRLAKVQLQSSHDWGGDLATLVDVTASQATKYLECLLPAFHQMLAICPLVSHAAALLSVRKYASPYF